MVRQKCSGLAPGLHRTSPGTVTDEWVLDCFRRAPVTFSLLEGFLVLCVCYRTSSADVVNRVLVRPGFWLSH